MVPEMGGIMAARIAVAVLTSLLAGLPRPTSALSTDETKAIATVFSRFETVLFVTGRVAAERPDPEHLAAVDAVRGPVAFAHDALDLAASGAAGRVLASSASVVVGAKDFRAPGGRRGLGGVRSTMCFVFVLRPEARIDPGALLRTTSRTGGQVPLWNWHGPRGEGDPEVVSVFAASASTSYFVLGNNRDEVVALVRALKAEGEIPLPSPLKEAGVGDQTAWAYRAFRHAQANPMAAGTTDIAPSTKALVVVPAGTALYMRLLGTPDDTTAKRLNEQALFAPFTEEAPGIWQTAVPVLANNEATARGLLGVLSLLGFGIYL